MGLINIFKNESKIDSNSLSNIVYTLNLILEFKCEDKGNFIGLQIFGLNDKCDVVTFNNATSVFFKVLYCGSSVSHIFKYNQDYKPYSNYISLFNMFEENDGYSFCCKCSLNGGSATATINNAFSKVGINNKVQNKYESVYISLL